jgi:hypothetical protein
VREETTVSELGYDDGVELFLHDLGGGGLSGPNGRRRLANCAASQQHRQVMGHSTGVATSRTDRSETPRRRAPGR